MFRSMRGYILTLASAKIKKVTLELPNLIACASGKRVVGTLQGVMTMLQ